MAKVKSVKVAGFGSISHGTMRPEDLIPTFLSELRSLGGKCATKYGKLLNIGREDSRAYWDSEEPQWDLEALFNALEEHAPAFGYFGSSEGDGADYGFWFSSDSFEESARDGTVLKIDASDEWPDPLPDVTDYVAEISDHGNITLFSAHDKRELWAIV